MNMQLLYFTASHLNHVVSEGSVKLDIGQKPGVVAGAEAGLDDALSVAEDVELRQRHVRGHLHRLLPVLPAEFQVCQEPASKLHQHQAKKLVESTNSAVRG